MRGGEQLDVVNGKQTTLISVFNTQKTRVVFSIWTMHFSYSE
jgi:hypothetical protein